MGWRDTDSGRKAAVTLD